MAGGDAEPHSLTRAVASRWVPETKVVPLRSLHFGHTFVEEMFAIHSRWNSLSGARTRNFSLLLPSSSANHLRSTRPPRRLLPCPKCRDRKGTTFVSGTQRDA